MVWRINMFKFYSLISASGKIKDVPKGYYAIESDPSYCLGYQEILVCSKQSLTFDELILCLKKCFIKADYVGCYSLIFWKYYKEFYEWIKKSYENNNTSNIRIIKKFYKKFLVRWLKFTKHSDDTLYPQNKYFLLMQKEIEKI